MTKHALIVLCLGGIVFLLMARACAIPAESQPGGASATWAPGQADPRGRVWLPVTGAVKIQGKFFYLPPSQVKVGADFLPVGVWTWVDVAVARAEAGKPTHAPTPTRTATPTPTRPSRPTRTARATGTPTQGRMATVPACGCDTPEPGEGTRFPGCWPYGGTCVPTETPTPTPTAYPTDTPPASATWEPTPTPRIKASPVAGGWVEAPGVWLYRFPLLLVWRSTR